MNKNSILIGAKFAFNDKVYTLKYTLYTKIVLIDENGKEIELDYNTFLDNFERI
jgi:hypothetical protein